MIPHAAAVLFCRVGPGLKPSTRHYDFTLYNFESDEHLSWLRDYDSLQPYEETGLILSTGIITLHSIEIIQSEGTRRMNELSSPEISIDWG